MLLCKKIKIEVSPRDTEALEFMQARCRGLYNWWVMQLRNGGRWRVNEAKKALRESKQYDPELCYVYGKLLGEVYFPNATGARRNRAAICISRVCTNGSPRSSDENNTTVCIKPPILSRTDWLKGLW